MSITTDEKFQMLNNHLQARLTVKARKLRNMVRAHAEMAGVTHVSADNIRRLMGLIKVLDRPDHKSVTCWLNGGYHA